MKINQKKLTEYFFIFFFISIVNSAYSEQSIYKLESLKISYKDKSNLIIAEGNAYAKDQFGNEIYSDKIIYNKLKSIIYTDKNSIFKDSKGNIIKSDKFYYDLNSKIIKAKNNVYYSDKDGNKFNFSDFEFFEKINKGIGLDATGELTDKSTVQGQIIELDNEKKIITLKNNNNKKNFFKNFFEIFNKKNNTYTPCENLSNIKDIYGRCPDWSVTTIKTEHNKIKKTVSHEHAVIKIKNIPIFYTPYFSHPDPTVKRQSGFLTPSTKNFSNLGRTFKTPYFWSIDENSDLTFTPIFYQDENSIFLTEYRKQNKNNYYYIDTSYSKGYKNLDKKNNEGGSLNRTNGSRNHFFLKFLGNYNDILLDYSDIEFNIQRISQKNYLSVNQINTNNIKQDISALKNNFVLNSYKNNQNIKISGNIYEDLSNDNPNTKYQYIIPSIEHNNYFEKFDHNINLFNTIEAKNFDGDTKQVLQINKFSTISHPIIYKKIGITNTIKTSIHNSNMLNDNVASQKENFSSDIVPILGIESSIPLIKNKENTEETIEPKIFFKYALGSMSNSNDTNKILSFEDIYSMDRMNSITNPETGRSLGYGLNYEINKKNLNSDTYLKSNFSIGQILKDKKSKEMPNNSSLNDKSSNFVGNFNFFLNKALLTENNKKNISRNYRNSLIKEGFDMSYEYNISNNLNKILKNDLKVNYKTNKKKIGINYYETHEIDNTHYIEANFEKNFDNNLNIILKARKNLELKYSESNFIELNYESDCLKIGVSLSKSFYENDDIQSNNSLNLFVMLKPFGQPVAPDLSNLISK